MKISYEPKKVKGGNAGSWIRRLVLAWILAAGLEFAKLPGAVRTLEGLEALAWMSPGRMVMAAAVVFLMSCVIFYLIQNEVVERWLVTASFAALAVLSLTASFTWAFGAVCLLVLGVLTVYALRGWDRTSEAHGVSPEKAGIYGWLTALGALAFFGIVSAWTVCRI